MKIRKKRGASPGGSNRFLLFAAAGAAVYFLFFRKSGATGAALPFSTEPYTFNDYYSWVGDWSKIPSGGYGGNLTSDQLAQLERNNYDYQNYIPTLFNF